MKRWSITARAADGEKLTVAVSDIDGFIKSGADEFVVVERDGSQWQVKKSDLHDFDIEVFK